MPAEPRATRAQHWDEAYEARGAEGVSWFQQQPTVSLELIGALGVTPASSVIDVGGGASPLAGTLVARGFSDVTVIDVSHSAIELAKKLTGQDSITYVCADLLSWQPGRRYDLWHDRAVLHFLVAPEDRALYLVRLRSAVAPNGAVVIATFAEDGPDQCSGLPVARYAPDQLESLLAPEFRVVRDHRERHVTPGGAVQPFTWIAARRS